MAFGIIEFMESLNNSRISFMGDSFQVSSRFNIHLHPLEATYQVLHQCNVYFSLPIISPIAVAVIWMEPCARYLEF